MTELALIEDEGLPVFQSTDWDEGIEVFRAALKEETSLQLVMGAVAYKVYATHGEGSLKAFAEELREESAKTIANYAWVYGRLLELPITDQGEIVRMMKEGPLKYSHLRRASREKDNGRFMSLMRRVHDEDKSVKWVGEQMAVRDLPGAYVPDAEATDEDYNPIPAGIKAEVVRYEDEETLEGEVVNSVSSVMADVRNFTTAEGWLGHAEQIADACAVLTSDAFRAAVMVPGREDIAGDIRRTLGGARASLDASLMVLYGSDIDPVTGEIIDDPE